MGNRASKTHLRVFITEVARKLYYPQHDLLFAAVVNGKQRLPFGKDSREGEQRVPRPSFPLGDISPRSTFRFRHCSVDWSMRTGPAGVWSQTVFTSRREQDGAQVRAPQHNAGVSAGKAHRTQAVARDILKQSSQRNKNVM